MKTMKKLFLMLSLIGMLSVKSFAMINLLESQVMSKPIEVSDVVKLEEARQQLRELRRKSAIEQAKRDALNPDGTLDLVKLRTSLIAQGFGENSDEVVNAVTK